MPRQQVSLNRDLNPDFPSPPYRATKSTITGLSGVNEGAVAYATDTDEFGYYTGSSWIWIKPGSGSGFNADLLDGQHGSYYLNASNINAGTLSTDRFSAYSDLSAESRLGMITGRIPLSDHVRMLGGDILYSAIRNDFTQVLESGWAWAGTPFSVPSNKDIQGGTWLRIWGLSANQACFLYQNNPSSTWEVWTRLYANAIPYLEMGLRLDDGTNNNYIEAYFTTTPVLGLRICINGSIVYNSTATPWWSKILPYQVLGIYFYPTGGGGVTKIMEITQEMNSYLNTSYSYFTPSRRGIYTRQSTYDGRSEAWFDFFASTH
jgi:hypothetical protein